MLFIHNCAHILVEDFEKMQVLSFRINPKKHSLYFPELELLIPCGEIDFSRSITKEGKNLVIMGQGFPIIKYDAFPKARIYRVKVNKDFYDFYTDINSCNQEKLLAVRD